MKTTILIFFMYIVSNLFAQSKSYIVTITEYKGNYYEIDLSNIILEINSYMMPMIGFGETVKLSTYNGIAIEVCFEEENYKYNYYSGENEYKTDYTNCISIDEVFLKISPYKLNMSGTKAIGSWKEIIDVEYFLIPCEGECFD